MSALYLPSCPVHQRQCSSHCTCYAKFWLFCCKFTHFWCIFTGQIMRHGVPKLTIIRYVQCSPTSFFGSYPLAEQSSTSSFNSIPSCLLSVYQYLSSCISSLHCDIFITIVSLSHFVPRLSYCRYTPGDF